MVFDLFFYCVTVKTIYSLRCWRDSLTGERWSHHIPPLHQSSHGYASRVHGFVIKTKALAREILQATKPNSALKQQVQKTKLVSTRQN